MKKLTTVFSLLLIVMAVRSVMAETSLSVVESAIATGIEDRTPVGMGGTFPSDVEKLYCYSKIAGGDEGSVIKHVWYYGDKVMAEVELDIRSPLFRTWSSKRIIPSWTGPWKVEIIADDGTVLETLDFTIE